MDPKAALMGLLCALVLVVPLALWIGSIFLRVAISLTNKVFGGATPSDLDYYDDPSAYRHGRYPQARTQSGLAIPMPSTGRAMGILLLIGIVDFVVRCGIMMAAGVGSAFAPQGGNNEMGVTMAALIAIPVSFVVHITMLATLLPTSLGRAFMVIVFQFVIAVLLVLVVVAVIMALAVGHAGMR